MSMSDPRENGYAGPCEDGPDIDEAYFAWDTMDSLIRLMIAIEKSDIDYQSNGYDSE